MKTSKRMRRQLMELPEEIVFNILSRLPVSSLCCTRCVSKALLQIVDDPFFIALHTARLVTVTNPVADDHHQIHMLMSFARPSDRSEGLFLDLQSLKYDGTTGSLTKGRYAVRVSNSSSDQSERAVYHVHFVYCNLFLLKDGLHQDSFLLNPLRGGEVLRLPRSTNTQHSIFAWGDWYGMGFDSTSNTHKILHVTWNRQVAEVLVLGTRSWREISSVPPLGLSNKRHVCAYGNMHWLVCSSNYKFKLDEDYEGASHILSFDFKKEEFYRIPHPTLYSSAEHPHYFHLLTLRGSMAILDASLSRPGGKNMSISIWVLKDYENKQWTLDYTMEIKKLETQPQFGFRYASCGEWEHGIFYKEGFARNITLFLDLRRDYANRVIRQRECDGYTNIFSYTQSLISLKDYASSAESEELITEGLKGYGNLIEGEEQGFSMYEKQMLRGSSSICKTEAAHTETIRKLGI